MGLTLASPVFAVSPSSILVDVVPENPAPYSDVTISLRSFAANLDSVTISWLVNGKIVSSGIGRKSFSVSVGASGSETTILASILLPDGQIDKTIILRPATMILLWQANDSYIPPFYRGKALPTADSEIKIVAMPEIKTGSGMVNPKNMTYFWKKNYVNDQGASGYGKNFFSFTSDYLDSTSAISVAASSVDQKYSAEAETSVGITEPEILFYKEDSGLGVLWERALSSPHVMVGEETVFAAPYFISPKDIRRPDLVWNWSINDRTVITKDTLRRNIIPLKTDAGVSGVSRLRLDIENSYKIFQSASKEINIQF